MEKHLDDAARKRKKARPDKIRGALQHSAARVVQAARGSRRDVGMGDVCLWGYSAVKFRLPREMAHATDLVRAGKILEATASLQQALAGSWRPSTAPQATEHVVARKAEAKVHVLHEERAPLLEPG